MLLHSCLVAVAFDAIAGEPPAALHPTVWMGRMLSFLKSILYARDGLSAKLRGALLVVVAMAIAIGAGLSLELSLARLLPPLWSALCMSALASLTIAPRSLTAHARPVLKGVCSFKCKDARKSLSLIVGRDTANLGRGEISRAAVESVAESLGDGVAAPLFFFAIFGLPGAFAYRMANTMDSMFGHKDERHLNFGWASARLDDLLNFLPARLLCPLATSLAAFVCKGASASVGGLRCVLRNHGRHPSPSAGWFEAMFAGVLGVRLGGVNTYEGRSHGYPLLNEAGRKPHPKDIAASMKLMWLATIFCATALDIATFAALWIVKSLQS